MALEDDVQSLLDWRDDVIDASKRNQDFDTKTNNEDDDLIRFTRDGTSYAITREDFQKYIKFESIPDNPDESDDGIYFDTDNDGAIIVLIRDGDKYEVANQIIDGEHVDDETFEVDGDEVTLKEGKLYNDGDDWFYYDGEKLKGFGNQNLGNSDLDLSDEREVELNGNSIHFKGDKYDVSVNDDGELALRKNGDEKVTFDIASVTDDRVLEVPDRSGEIALVGDITDNIYQLSKEDATDPESDEFGTVSGERLRQSFEANQANTIHQDTGDDEDAPMSQSAVTDGLDEKADDDKVVHIEDEETIEGKKDFEKAPTIQEDAQEDEEAVRKAQLDEGLDEKVDKENGKGLSTNDYDDNEKSLVNKIKDKAEGLKVKKDDYKLKLTDENGDEIDSVSLSFLSTDITMEYDDEEGEIVIKDGNGDTLSTFDADELVAGFGKSLKLSSTKLKLRDSNNDTISEVDLEINRIEGLESALNNRLEKDKNLSDLDSKTDARENLGLGELAEKNEDDVKQDLQSVTEEGDVTDNPMYVEIEEGERQYIGHKVSGQSIRDEQIIILGEKGGSFWGYSGTISGFRNGGGGSQISAVEIIVTANHRNGTRVFSIENNDRFDVRGVEFEYDGETYFGILIDGNTSSYYPYNWYFNGLGKNIDPYTIKKEDAEDIEVFDNKFGLKTNNKKVATEEWVTDAGFAHEENLGDLSEKDEVKKDDLSSDLQDELGKAPNQIKVEGNPFTLVKHPDNSSDDPEEGDFAVDGWLSSDRYIKEMELKDDSDYEDGDNWEVLEQLKKE